MPGAVLFSGNRGFHLATTPQLLRLRDRYAEMVRPARRGENWPVLLFNMLNEIDEELARRAGGVA